MKELLERLRIRSAVRYLFGRTTAVDQFARLVARDVYRIRCDAIWHVSGVYVKRYFGIFWLDARIAMLKIYISKIICRLFSHNWEYFSSDVCVFDKRGRWVRVKLCDGKKCRRCGATTGAGLHDWGTIYLQDRK